MLPSAPGRSAVIVIWLPARVKPTAMVAAIKGVALVVSMGLLGWLFWRLMRRDVQALLSGQLHVQYGATECGIATVAGPSHHALHPDTVGVPRAGVEVRVVDALKKKGVHTVACLSVNDVFVMDAWGKASGADGKVVREVSGGEPILSTPVVGGALPAGAHCFDSRWHAR